MCVWEGGEGGGVNQTGEDFFLSSKISFFQSYHKHCCCEPDARIRPRPNLRPMSFELPNTEWEGLEEVIIYVISTRKEAWEIVISLSAVLLVINTENPILKIVDP